MEPFSKQDNVRIFVVNEAETRKILRRKGIELDYETLLAVLLDTYDLPPVLYAEIIHKRLSAAEMVQAVETYFMGLGVFLGEVTLNWSILPPDALNDELSKAEVTLGNEKWRLHRNDVDPFPSKPHAHNMMTGLKLHLGNGRLFKKHSVRGQVHHKDLLLIRGQFAARFPDIILPPLEI